MDFLELFRYTEPTEKPKKQSRSERANEVYQTALSKIKETNATANKVSSELINLQSSGEEALQEFLNGVSNLSSKAKR